MSHGWLNFLGKTTFRVKNYVGSKFDDKKSNQQAAIAQHKRHPLLCMSVAH